MNIDFFELLQLNDATFPIGSYTHSWGLETFVQRGIIFNEASAESYFRIELKTNFLTNEFLAVRLAYEAAKNKKWNEVKKIDSIYNASRNAKEVREGSKKLGARFLKTLSVWTDIRELQKLHHFPVVYGSYCAQNGMDEDTVLKAFLYSQISSRITTAVKLVPLSQTEGQKILHGLFNEFEKLLDQVKTLKEKDLCRSSPKSEILCMQHEYLYTRLYMS